MEKILLKELIDRTESALQELNYKESVLHRYRIEFRAVECYFSACDQETFSKALVKDYLTNASLDHSQELMSRIKYYRISWACDKLLQCYEQGNITRFRRLHRDLANPSNSSEEPGIIRAYRSHIISSELSTNTRRNYLRVVTHFMAYAVDKGYQELHAMSQKDVSDFIPYISEWYKNNSMSVVLTALRSLFRFARDHHYCDWDMSLALPRLAAKKTVVQQPLTSEEETRLIQSIDRSTPTGKRDYALIILIMRTGLRTVDVMNLTLKDIDWRRKEIQLIQQKTQRPIVMPLLPEVGDAIAEYLLDGRPMSSTSFVFLRTMAPHIGFQDPYSCSQIIQRRMKAAGIRQMKASRNGGHCLRHSLAYRLLQEATPLTVISSILGHKNKDSSQKYLSTDIESLRACSLTLAGIEIKRGCLL